MRDLQLQQGSWFNPGQREIVIGKSVAKRYPAAQLGRTLRFGRGEWAIVGVMDAGQSAVNSEIFGDLAPFAATAYVAMQAAATAALDSCRDGQATRAGVANALPKTAIKTTVLGSPVAFDEHHELIGSRYWMYRIEGGTYQLVQ